MIEITLRNETILGEAVTGVFLRDLSEREALVNALAGRAAELARSNRDLEQFAYVASHDLQEPLRMVGSYTQLLKQRYGSRLDSDANEFMDFAQQGAARMRNLIDDLLAFSRIGTQGRPFAPISMEEVLATSELNLRATIESSGAIIAHGPLPTISGDGGQLAQVLQNLLGNAIKFHGPGPAHIQVEARRDGPEWTFSVHDDGIGIRPEYQDRIFTIFQRLHTREEYPGSGIGLSVCKKVVERHDGRIWVESHGVPGEGSTFFFTLPAERVALPTASKAAPKPSESPAVRTALSLIEERLQELV
jgi:light-regulated signal transduction histidine kinase (bacteriophytochrome)